MMQSCMILLVCYRCNLLLENYNAAQQWLRIWELVALLIVVSATLNASYFSRLLVCLAYHLEANSRTRYTIENREKG